MFWASGQAGGDPAERHLGIAPALDVVADLSNRSQRVLDHVGAGERAPEFMGQAETDDGEDFVQALENAPRDPRFLLLQTPGQVAQQPFGLVRVVLVPSQHQKLSCNHLITRRGPIPRFHHARVCHGQYVGEMCGGPGFVPSARAKGIRNCRRKAPISP